LRITVTLEICSANSEVDMMITSFV